MTDKKRLFDECLRLINQEMFCSINFLYDNLSDFFFYLISVHNL